MQDDRIYQGTSKSRLKDIDKASIIKELSPVPRENIYPPCPSYLTRAPEIYIKIPDLTLYTPERKDIIPERLGLVHNDLNPLNVMFTDKGKPVLLNFDTCHPIGTTLDKCGQVGEWKGIPSAAYEESSTECDLKALEYLEVWLKNKYEEMKDIVSNVYVTLEVPLRKFRDLPP